MTYPKYLGSSIDPQQLSLTIKGILASIVPVVLVFAPMFHWTVTADDFSHFSDSLDGFFSALQALIVAVTGIISAAMVIWGALRKILVAVGVYKA